MFQTKEQDKNSEKKTLNIKKISNLPHKEFKTKVIKMLTKLKNGMDEHGENFNIDSIREY